MTFFYRVFRFVTSAFTLPLLRVFNLCTCEPKYEPIMQVFGRVCAVRWFPPQFADRMSQAEPFSE